LRGDEDLTPSIPAARIDESAKYGFDVPSIHLISKLYFLGFPDGHARTGASLFSTPQQIYVPP
jgi:hypothetical protein